MSDTRTLIELIDAYAIDAAALGKADETLPGIHRAEIVRRLAEVASYRAWHPDTEPVMKILNGGSV